MYWPIGAPNAFAFSKQGRDKASSSTEDGRADNVSRSNGVRENPARPSPKLEGLSHQAERDGLKDGNDEDLNTAVSDADGDIVAAAPSQNGNTFAIITATALTVWQRKPTVALTTVERSTQSLATYGRNVAVFLRADSVVIVVQTELDYLLTYDFVLDHNHRVYQAVLRESNRHTRTASRDVYNGFRRSNTAPGETGPGEANGVIEAHLRFQSSIKIEAGIKCGVTTDEELIISTTDPPALQIIRWREGRELAQPQVELLSKMPWCSEEVTIVDMIHERLMNLTCWLTSDGSAYILQSRKTSQRSRSSSGQAFHGFCFRNARSDRPAAKRIAVNARFSLIAVACDDGTIEVFTVKDYTGNVPLSHTIKLNTPRSSSGALRFLTYSPDGYCLFAGYERGWAMWSVYGKPGATSFICDKALASTHRELWLLGLRTGFWVGNGCEMVMIAECDDRIWTMDMARGATIGCMNSANISRGLLLSNDSFMIYQGHGETDLTAIPSETSLWLTVPIHPSYLAGQYPIRYGAVSADGKYIAVAGPRGLAHYSVSSGRWKVFDDPQAEQEFSVRGGMCWHQHFLIASVQIGAISQIRIYSREKSLSQSSAVFVEDLTAPAITVTVSGTDSLLVYTADNILQHYIFAPSGSAIRLVPTGQIGFQGIIRSPARVRSISWVLPDNQLEYGDPSQDVVTASVLFLVDAKLVMLQPTTNEQGELKYDMRVIANNVEYFLLLRDQPLAFGSKSSTDGLESNESPFLGSLGHSLRDSLWYFDGDALHVWSDIQDVLARAPIELGRDQAAPARVPVDFYPISVLVAQGIIHGWDIDLVQRKDIDFALLRPSSCTQLFLPKLLHHHLAEYNAPSALHLANSYQYLPYFPHALEILLHDVLDKEVDEPPFPPETALLPGVISFLSSFPAFLDVVVNCTRKTELRSWKTLFTHLPPVTDLFEQSLTRNKLKTAAGYLLVLHTFESDEFQVTEFSRLLRAAATAPEPDWELARELARFLMGIDSTGRTLQAALAEAGMDDGSSSDKSGKELENKDVKHITSLASQIHISHPSRDKAGPDYFSLGQKT